MLLTTNHTHLYRMKAIFYFTLILGFATPTLAQETSERNITDSQQYPDQEKLSIMPRYGHWCGPNFPKRLSPDAPAPIDTLDTLCKKHDYCYEEQGYMACDCDRQFSQEIALQLELNHFKGTEELFAHALTTYFENALCIDNGNVYHSYSEAIENIIDGTENKATKLLEALPKVTN